MLLKIVLTFVDEEKVQKNSIYIEIFINIFTYELLNASLLNKSINFFSKIFFLKSYWPPNFLNRSVRILNLTLSYIFTIKN